MGAALQTLWLQVVTLMALEAALLAVLLALVLRAIRSPGWRRTFCQATLIALLLITGSELSGAGRMFAGWFAKTVPRWNRREVFLSQAPSQHLGAAVTHNHGVTISQTEPSSGPVSLSESVAPALEPSEPSIGSRGLMTDFWLCLAWFSGSVLLGIRALLAHFLFLLFRLRQRPITEPVLLERIERLARSLGIKRRVRIAESARLSTPIAFGVVQPALGLPTNFMLQFDAARQTAMLAHELAHLAAHDPLWCLAADLVTIFLWWHPAVWWMRRQLHLASEMAADEASLLIPHGPRMLAECLVQFGLRLANPLGIGHLRVSGFRSHLGHRVRRLLDLNERPWSPPHRLPAGLIRSLGPLMMTSGLILCTAWVTPVELMKGDSMKSMKLNWKNSLATFSIVAAMMNPNANAVEPNNAADASAARAQPEQPAVAPGQNADSSAAQSTPATALQEADPSARTSATERPRRGARIEAKLNQLVLDEIRFDGLPLSEVLAERGAGYLEGQSRPARP